jgi:hypothetical protein
MMVKFLTASLGAIAVMGQVPDLREGDCVRALDDIEYEGDIPPVRKGHRGMVTGKGISWENRDWKFKYSAAEQQYLFQQRNAVIHRSMVEKMSETEGYGTIEKKKDGTGSGKCLTVFELEAIEDKVAQSPKVQWWDCEHGWADQIFIYPACGLGPGQIRWAKDPQMCLYRQVHNMKLVLSKCEWTQPFIFKIFQGYKGWDDRQLEGKLKVGAIEPDTDAQAHHHPRCFDTSDSQLGGNIDCASKDGTKVDCFAHSSADASGTEVCTEAIFKGLWNAEILDV